MRYGGEEVIFEFVQFFQALIDFFQFLQFFLESASILFLR